MSVGLPRLLIWPSQDSFSKNEKPIQTYHANTLSVQLDGTGIWGLSEDDVRQMPDDAYILLEREDSFTTTLYYSVAPSLNRLALWQLASSGAQEGDMATFDGVRWVPDTLKITANALPLHAQRHGPYGDDPIDLRDLGAAQLHNNYLAVWQMPSAGSIDDLLAGSERWNGWCIEDTYNPPATPTAKQPQMAYADGNGTRWYGEPLRPTKTPLLQVIDSVDKLPTEVCAVILNTVPPKLILRGSDGLIYDAVGNLLQ